MAAWNGPEAVVEALIAAGAEVNKAANNSKTPLSYDARDGMSLIWARAATGRAAVVPGPANALEDGASATDRTPTW